MNIINDRRLALRFKNGEVPSREVLFYFLIFIMAYQIPWNHIFEYVFDDYSKYEYDAYDDIATISITIIGTIICYNTNKNGDNRDFLERYVGIGFPVTVSMIIFLIFMSLISAVFYVLNDLYFKFNFGVSMDAWVLAMGLFTLVGFFWRLNSSIKLAASTA